MKISDPRGRFALYASHLGDYMHRWILRTPWFTLRVHHILKSDEGRDFHDHPFSFVSFILRGGYVEHVPGCVCERSADHPLASTLGALWLKLTGRAPYPCEFFGPGTVIHRQAEQFHRLELLPGRTAWTFVISTRYFRPWGFLLKDGTWVHYQEYHRSYYQPEQTR